MPDSPGLPHIQTTGLVWPGGPSKQGPHRVGAFAICPQLEAWSQDLRLTPAIEKDAPLIGTLVHAGAAYRYGALLPERPSWLVYPSARDAVWILGCGTGRHDAAAEALRVWDAYEAWYANNVWRPLLVEHQFEVTIESEPYTARLDLIAVDEYGQVCLIDHKTRSRMSSDHVIEAEYASDRQMLTCLALAQTYGYDVKRVIINVITRERPTPRFKRVDIPISALAFGRLLEDTAYYLRQMKAVRQQYPDPQNRPRNWDACYRKYGLCDFRPLCSDGLHHIDQFKKR